MCESTRCITKEDVEASIKRVIDLAARPPDAFEVKGILNRELLCGDVSGAGIPVEYVCNAQLGVWRLTTHEALHTLQHSHTKSLKERYRIASQIAYKIERCSMPLWVWAWNEDVGYCYDNPREEDAPSDDCTPPSSPGRAPNAYLPKQHWGDGRPC